MPRRNSSTSTKIKTLTSFQVRLIVSLLFLGASTLFALVSYPSFRMAGNSNNTNSTNASNTNVNMNTNTNTNTNANTNTSEDGCCEITCPNGEKTCDGATTKDLCTQDSCDNGALGNICDTNNLGWGCKSVEWKEGCECEEPPDSDKPRQCVKKGCCYGPATDGPGYGYWCVPDLTKEECDIAVGAGGPPGIWDEYCNTCDQVTNTCRESLCCKLDSNQCVSMKYPRECEDAGGIPQRGQCNKTTGECEKTGCCDFPDPDNTQDHQTTQEECGVYPWYEGLEWNLESHSCKDEVGCCNASDITACVDSTKTKCEGAGATWLKGAACNYRTGSCSPSSDPVLSVTISPNSHLPYNKYIRPITSDTLLCSGVVMDYRGWTVDAHIVGWTGQEFPYYRDVCASGKDPCNFSISVPSTATHAGDTIKCILGVYDSSGNHKSTSDDTTIQACVYLGASPVPQETTSNTLMDVMFLGDKYADPADYNSWKSTVSRFKSVIATADPFSQSQLNNKIRYWRYDGSGFGGGGNDFGCDDSANCSKMGTLIITSENGEDGCDIGYDRRIVVLNHDENLKGPKSFSGIGTNYIVIPSKKMFFNFLSPESAMLHEFGHQFGLGDESFYIRDVRNISRDNGRGLNCGQRNESESCMKKNGGIFANPPGTGWCDSIKREPVAESPCAGLKVNILPDGTLDPASECLSKLGCVTTGPQYFNATCKNLDNFSCFKRRPICDIGSVCFVYQNRVCMNTYSDLNIGDVCDKGTGCYPGCDNFRSSIDSIMNNRSNTRLYNEVSKKIIKDQILCETGGAATCPVIQEPPSVYSEPF